MKNSQQQETQKKKLKKHIVENLTVRKENTVYFNDYLQQYVGAKWQQIKNSLYDAGYTTIEVSTYRDKLLEEFREICHRNKLHGII
jgi:5,10-methylene-tetrahydrofolate dehydrogenase/methenyl tetrahydrofolate cyclohydrolase